jgi:hypothetical protein
MVLKYEIKTSKRFRHAELSLPRIFLGVSASPEGNSTKLEKTTNSKN